jgi:2-desacetyl-2-hydroxyethyl bacteriochlorophyllide A dehydrogenase
MKAAVFHRAGIPLQVETVDDPRPAPDEVILKVERCGICGTDLHLTGGHKLSLAAGTVPGHEFSGRIETLGKDVRGLNPGDLVAAMPMLGCGHCEACHSGSPVFCASNARMIGLDGRVSGGYAQYVRAQAQFCVKLPAALSAEDGALVEPLAVALHGTQLASIRAGDRVLIIGAGPIGLCAAFWTRKMGAREVVMVASSDRRMAFAAKMGATKFLRTGDQLLMDLRAEMSGPPDVVLECVGSPGLMNQAVKCVRVLGTVVVLGFCVEPDVIDPIVAIRKEVKILYSNCYSLGDYRRAVDVLDSGAVEPRQLVSSVVSLEALPDAFEALRGPSPQCKVMVDPWI